MGQSQSKTTSGQDAKKDQNQAHSEESNDVGSVPASSAASNPTLGTKLFQMFSKPADVSTVSQAPSALYKSPYAPASPLPPSSSTLAQSFRKEFTGDSPAQQKPNSSFFLGKVLISPRRPLREHKSSSTCAAVTSPLAYSSVGYNAKGSVGETPNYNLPTPKSLKRKAQSPEYGNRNKSLRLERTASPALKNSFLTETLAAQVEEQEEEEEKQVLVAVSEAETDSEMDGLEVASQEVGDCVGGVNSVDEVDNTEAAATYGEAATTCDEAATTCDEAATACDEAATAFNEETGDNIEHPASECDETSSHERLIDESSMTAPYSPSQQPKSLVSAIDISLTSMISCASPATVLFRRDSTHDDLDVSDADASDLNVTTKSLDETVLQKLKDLKEYFLPAADSTSSQSNNLVIDSTQESSAADTTLLEETRSLPAAPDDNAVDMNGASRLESMEVPPNETSDIFEDCEHGDVQSAGDQSIPNKDSSVGSVVASDASHHNVSTGYNGSYSAREGSVTSSCSGRSCQEEMDVNTLPHSSTTDCSTISKKQWLSEYKVTESKSKSESAKNSSEPGDKEASKTSEPVHMRPRCSEDAYYHYPPVLSTFTSSISRMKWPSLSISTSSASALGISSVDLFKSLPFFGSSLPDVSAGSSQSAATVEEADADTSSATNGVSSALNTSGTESIAVPSTNGSVELEIADCDVEEQLNGDHDANLVSTIENENNKSSETNGCLDTTSENNKSLETNGISETTSSVSVSGLSAESPVSWTPKRSSRIASRYTTTPNSSIKSLGNRIDSTQHSSAGTATTPVSANRRRRRRSPSTDSNASKQSASQSSLERSPASSSRRAKKRRNGGSRDSSLEGITDETTSQDEMQLPKRVDGEISSNSLQETSQSSKGGTVEDNSTEPSKKASKKSKIEDALQKTVAVLREDRSADYISNSQVLMLVRRSSGGNSGALLRRLRQRFPHGSVVAADGGKPQHRGKKRGGHALSRQVERSIMQGRSPILVDVARGVSLVPLLFLAHSANYNSLCYHEGRYLDPSTKKVVQPSLPFCYSWFLNLTDSLELARAGKQFLSRLLAVPVCQRDLVTRTRHQGSVAELVSSLVPNNIVGGPEILHCTAKGGASTDAAYSAKPEVVAALGGATTLRIVGFVLTPRTFGARVKLTPEQMLVWGNSDKPSVPKEIGQLFAEQEDITKEGGALVGSSEDEGDAGSSSESGPEDTSETLESPALNKKAKKTLKMVDVEDDTDVFCPTSGPGSRAHITLGCFSRDVHPRTTGFDLLKVIEKEQQVKQSSDSATKNRTTVEESNHDSDMEVDAESSALAKPSLVSTESETSEGSGDLSLNFSKSNDVTAASVRVEGATARCYGDGVWVVYPDQAFEVTAMFSGFHNND